MVHDTPLWRLSAAALADGFRERRFTPSEALESVLGRIAERNPALNAIVTLDANGARAAAADATSRHAAGRPLSPLDGVPLTVKDNIPVAGLRCTWGSRLFEHRVAPRDELPVARLRAAGAVILGKTNTPEFAMQGYTDNLVFGATHNPWNPALTPGGSSGGAVAAVASGMGPLALATDGGGSIRRPASHTGLFGFKPSEGRVPRADGLPPIFLHYEVAGPIARSIEDIALAMQVLSPPDARDAASQAFMGRPFEWPRATRPLRILHVPTLGDSPVDAEIAASVTACAADFAARGHAVTTADAFDLADAVTPRWMRWSQAGLARLMTEHAAWRTLLTDGAVANAEAGMAMRATDLFELAEAMGALRDGLARLFETCDAILTPAAAALPWPVGVTHPDTIAGRPVGPRGHAVFTGFVNAAGLPAIAFPCRPSSNGLPIGAQLIGPWGSDALLCATVAHLHADWPPE
jgi:aspartyl-tRNA(Asn)/glutamyl-tRNA(Gln) amidotransferase subunit A